MSAPQEIVNLKCGFVIPNNLQRQIDATDRQIDLLVYELYGLTDEEIKIVEGE